MAIRSCLTSSLMRHFPCVPPPRGGRFTLDAALNERMSFQVAIRNSGPRPRTVRIEADGPGGWSVAVRRVGLVPVPHHNEPIEPDDADLDGRGRIPGYVPDPLFPEDSVLAPPGETHAFWITVQPGERARPGRHAIRVTRSDDGTRTVTHLATIRLHDVVLPPRRDFHITHWFYVDALIDRYRTDLFDRRFWPICGRYMSNLADHGQDTIYVPVFTPPLDGVKRPSQLLDVQRTGPSTWRFDWRDVRRYVRLAQQCGLTHFEWCHLFTQWGAAQAIRVYEGQGRDEKPLWRPGTGATARTYRRFLAAFLPQLHAFLRREGILDRSFFHVSDEPHGGEHLQNYRVARELLGELAPWMKVMDALSDIRYAREGLTDMPVPSIEVAPSFAAAGTASWCYYCCGPRGRHLNRLLDTPLPKIAMHGLLFYRWPFHGFLHWGANYWYRSQTRELIDPFTVQDGAAWSRGWAYGDPFVVYPGPDGPLDSIRWEVFAESLQDYRLLQARGVDRDDPRLAPMRGFAEFPKAASWRKDLRSRLLSG